MNWCRLLLLASLALPACRREARRPAPGANPGTPNAFSITVDAQGFHPPSITAHAGQAIRVTFRRTSDEGCGQQVLFPDLNLRRDLPLDTEVAVDVTVPPRGALAFTCGMGMLRGSIVVQ